MAREALPGRIRTFVEEALRASAVASNADDALAAFTADLNAMWDAPPSLFVPREQEPEHPHVHVVRLNNASEPAYRRRFQAFEHGPVQPHRVHRWTVLSHVLSPEHSDPGRRLDFGDLFDSL
ncbi:hypothetical protein LGM69_25280 [Burkholderia multivorans]|nr:hypothetical protein [Burkholderia multivorans]